MMLYVFLLGVFGSIASAQEELGPIHQRTIPADVLRDFNTFCFIYAKNQFLNVTERTVLPFCAATTCVEEGGFLKELVEECRLPKVQEGCEITNDQTATFPGCCPVSSCPEAGYMTDLEMYENRVQTLANIHNVTVDEVKQTLPGPAL